MMLILTMIMLTATASAYWFPSAPAQRRCPARAPVVQAFVEDEKIVPMTAACLNIQPLTTVAELNIAVSEAKAAGRLAVVKIYAPWCSACRAIQQRYLRMAKSHPGIDFYEVDFTRSKPLCSHLSVEGLPTGLIFKDGQKVEHSSMRPSQFKKFMGKLSEHFEPEALELYKSNMDELRARVTELREGPSSRISL